MFATLSLSGNRSMNLKCNPTLALELRDQYDAVIPGYHMNKKHWNTIDLDLLANEKLLHEWIDHSYDLVWQKLPKRIKTAFDLDQ
ncbi:UNVERIFIED_CONTAM: hypothetical protein GTU68_030918 [Idotea baltica]|nr:hypothetical protein [Idotea baltica]